MNTLAMSQGAWFGSRYIAALLVGFKEHRILYSISVFSVGVAYLESLWLGLPPNIELVSVLSVPVVLIVGMFVILGLGLEMLRLSRIKHEGALLPALWDKLSNRDFTPQRVSNALHFIVCLSLFTVSFTAMKAAIPQFNPFSWDDSFIALDKALHFGSHPYEVLAPVLNFPLVTAFLNFIYKGWFFVTSAFLFGLGFYRSESRLRQHFLVAFMVTWFVGTPILGTVFSSVGPGLYNRLYPDVVNPFQPLMAWLDHTNQFYKIYTVEMMDELWNSYIDGKGLISGISAMPSMHVGSSVLFLLCAIASGKRWLVWSMASFTAMIFLGSIHLGWHYAIDGYLGAAVAVVSWWCAGKLTRWDRNARDVA